MKKSLPEVIEAPDIMSALNLIKERKRTISFPEIQLPTQLQYFISKVTR